MRKTLTALLISCLVLSACGTIRNSRVNPFNWFGKSRSDTVQTTRSTNPLIPRTNGVFAAKRADALIYRGVPFEQVTNLTVERVPGGAIIRATGLAARQGVYDVQLRPMNDTEVPVDGVLTYRLEGVIPPSRRAPPVGAAASREITAARKVTDQVLAGVRVIRVEGQSNAQVVAR